MARNVVFPYYVILVYFTELYLFLTWSLEKVSDRFDRSSNLYGNDAEKYPANVSRNVPIVDHGDVGSSILMNEKSRAGLIALEGCCSSEASKLLNDRKCP